MAFQGHGDNIVTEKKYGNFELFVDWKIAEKGDAAAQGMLGIMYAEGKGVPQNDVEAAKWTRLSADQGGADEQVALGNFYSNGKGVPQDYAEAMKWYRLAADQGDALAQVVIGATSPPI